jgi:serine phosphatase RsbU (regulator of sigma subunit)
MSLSGWESAGYYRPDRAQVGGDFYDALALRDGRLAVFIGDVMGHGITAAATMAQVRASIRALATVDPDPGTVMAHLDSLFEDLSVEPLVSLVYAVVHPAGRVRLANAGHLPPLVLGADGSARLLDERGRPPLGSGRAPAPVEELTIDPGSVLLLYTDGLVERRYENIDLGLKRLACQAARLTSGALDDELAGVAESLTGAAPPQDDVAALALRRRATAEGIG